MRLAFCWPFCFWWGLPFGAAVMVLEAFLVKVFGARARRWEAAFAVYDGKRPARREAQVLVILAFDGVVPAWAKLMLSRLSAAAPRWLRSRADSLSTWRVPVPLPFQEVGSPSC